MVTLQGEPGGVNPVNDTMKKTCTALLGLALTCGGLPTAQAAGVHKWVDAQGLTHYSDEPPGAVETTLIELPQPTVAKGDDDEKPAGDYYSISNQWQRMNQERLERERLDLERAKIRAARQTPAADTADRDEDEVRYVTVYRGFGLRRHHRRSHRIHRFDSHRPQAPASADLGTFPTQ